MKMKLSVVQATRNEEENIVRNLKSVRDIADEIIVVDEYSTDKTRELAEQNGAKVFLEPHHDVFHITKQKAIDKAKGDWILQIDTDEVVTPELSKEIQKILNGEEVKITDAKKLYLFTRHQKLLEQRDGKVGKEDGEVVAYFVPRVNMFLGKPLVHAGVYPDGVIRLFKRGKARLPGKSVHEQMEIDGRVGWLNESLLHYDSPTIKRYLSRLNRYTDLHATELKNKKVSKNLIGFLQYVFYKPIYTFIMLYFRHLGIMDGVNGFLWSFFSALHFPIAYFKYLTDE
jgi:glycosyltransferase involved in cell wall biosynthesis